MSTCQQLVRTYKDTVIARALRLTAGISCQLIAEEEHVKLSGAVRRLVPVKKELVARALMSTGQLR